MRSTLLFLKLDHTRIKDFDAAFPHLGQPIVSFAETLQACGTQKRARVVLVWFALGHLGHRVELVIVWSTEEEKFGTRCGEYD